MGPLRGDFNSCRSQRLMPLHQFAPFYTRKPLIQESQNTAPGVPFDPLAGCKLYLLACDGGGAHASK